MFFFFGAAFFLALETLLEEDALLAEAAFFCPSDGATALSYSALKSWNMCLDLLICLPVAYAPLLTASPVAAAALLPTGFALSTVVCTLSTATAVAAPAFSATPPSLLFPIGSVVLEELDPSEHYRGTPLEGLDAFQRQLKRFDIHVKGAGSDMVEKFFHTSDSAVLFPEFVSRVVRQGMEEESILPAITATVTKFDGMDYRSIASVPSEEDKKLRRVEEGARIPETTVRTQENLVHLHKRGRMLVASYEAIRFQRLDLFSVTLRQIGAYIGRMHLEDAIEVLRNGDGNQNAAQQYTIGTKPITGTKGTLTYDALLEFWSQFDPYTMNTMLVGSDVMLAMLKLDEFQNPLTGLNFQGTGTLTTPLGAKLLRTSAMPAGILIGLDRNYALEQICGSEITVEYDKLIDRQLERAAITSISGFAKLFTEASKVLVV